MLNIYDYYDEPAELPEYEELNQKINLLTYLLDLQPGTPNYEKYLSKESLLSVLNIIIRSPILAYKYAIYVEKGPWPEGEPAIKKIPHLACQYAENILKHRWLEAEDIIKTSPRYWDRYKKHFGIE